MSSQTRLSAAFVGDHGPPDDVIGQPSFEAGHRFARCLALADVRLLVEVAPTARHSDLNDGGRVQHCVQLTIAGA